MMPGFLSVQENLIFVVLCKQPHQLSADLHLCMHRVEFYMTVFFCIFEVEMQLLVASVLLEHFPEKRNIFFA